MNKRLFSMFLALCMIVTMLPVSAMAEENHTTIGGSGEIISFAPLTETKKAVSLGTSIEDLELPETLTATVRTAVPADENSTQDSGSSETATPTTASEPEWKETTGDIPVEWASSDYDMDTQGAYVFTPVIVGYTVSAPLPELTVTVGELPPIAAARGLPVPLSTEIYDLWVGGVQVTDTNKDDVLGDTDGDGATVTYDSDTNTLTLNGANITSVYTLSAARYGIYAPDYLNLKLVGTNAITLGSGSTAYGICTQDSDLQISAEEHGSLTVTTDGKYGIYSNHLTIDSGEIITARAVIWGTESVEISGGTVTSTGGTQGIVAPTLTISGGTVTASGSTAALYTGVFNFTGMQVTASTDESGDGAGAYDAANLENYKYIKVEPAPAVDYNIWVGGVQVSSANKDDVLGDGTVSYTPAADGTPQILTLSNVTIGAEAQHTWSLYDQIGVTAYSAVYAEGSLRLVLTGNNSLTGGSQAADNIHSYGLYCIGDLTITGNGSLEAIGAEMSGYSCNSYGLSSVRGTIEITNGVTVTARGGNVSNSSGVSFGVSARWTGDLVVDNATLTASAGTGYNSFGLRFPGDIRITDSTVNATSDEAYASSEAMSTYGGNIQISGGTVSAVGRRAITVPADKSITISSGAAVTAKGSNWNSHPAMSQAPNLDSYGDAYYITASTFYDGIYPISYVPTDISTYRYIAIAPNTPAPVVSSVQVPENGTYVPGMYLDFTVHFSESVTVTGTPYISLAIGSEGRNATYQSGSGTSALVFRYTVQSGDSDSDGISVGWLNLNDGTIKDDAGNNAVLTLGSIGSTAAILVHTPEETSITGQPSPQTVNAGQTAAFSVTATGDGLTYRWQVDTGSGFTYISNGGVYSGATTATLTITGATAVFNGYQYRAVVTGSYLPAVNSNSALLTVNTVPAKTVSAGSQSGTATAGTAGSLTYPVTTANIDDGTYAVSVANLPTGVIVGNSGNVTISGNSGTLTLTVADTAAAGTTGTLVLTLDGATSAAFSIVIGETTPNLSATDVTLDAVTAGYISSNYKSIVITNNGDAQATISSVTTDRPSVFSIHSGLSFVAAGSSVNSWQIRAATGLAVGTYTATITVTYDGGRTATATVSIAVNAVGNHTVTFNPNSGTVSEASRSVASGTAVGVLPTPTRSGSYSFDGWYTAASGGTQISASTTVSANVTYYAHWTYTGGGGSGGGGGSSSNDNSSPVIVTPPAPDKPNSPTQGEIKVPGTVDGKGNVTVSLTDKTVTDAFNKALAEAKKNGTEQNGITLVLRVDTGNKTGSNVTVNLPKAVQDTIIAKKIVNTIVVVDNPDIRIGMDLATVQEINKQAKTDVNITATRTNSGKLTGEAKKAIGSRPVFDLKVNYGNGKAVSSFGAGSVSVTIPYTLGANEKAGNVQAVYVDSKGKVHWLVNSVYDSVEKVLRFSTDHFSTYGIGYKQTDTAFTDIAGHWAKEDIEFVANRGLFSGTSETKFSPNTAMTRGMFVTALGRLANADVSGYAKSSFTDVKNDAYYMGYIEWANKNNIVNGIGDYKFAPDQSITREQMAVIMSNYSKTIGFILPKVHVENTFADSAKISAYAKESVKQMQMAGVISGKNGNLYDPQGTATRAEVSAVLRRFVELAISSDTAQGWTMNDSGNWMYFKDGKPLTGKQDIDGATYTFDQYGVTAGVPKNLRYTTYTVQKGDSFWSISRKLGCPMSELERLNNKSRFSLILPGEVLRVPEK